MNINEQIDSLYAEVCEKAKIALTLGGYSCVLLSADKQYSFTDSGIKPLMKLINSNIDVKGYALVDKVVGKAVALLAVYAGLAYVHGLLMSETAVAVLEKHGIKYSYNEMVPYIKNKDNTGYCPMEKKVIDVYNADGAYNIFSKIITDII